MNEHLIGCPVLEIMGTQGPTENCHLCLIISHSNMHARFAIQDSVVAIVNRINNFDDEVKTGVWINSWTALNEAIIEITNLVVDSAKLAKLEFEQRQADIPKL